MERNKSLSKDKGIYITQKVIKPQRKRAREERNREELQKHPENNEQNDNKHIPVNNYFKCK